MSNPYTFVNWGLLGEGKEPIAERGDIWIVKSANTHQGDLNGEWLSIGSLEKMWPIFQNVAQGINSYGLDGFRRHLEQRRLEGNIPQDDDDAILNEIQEVFNHIQQSDTLIPHTKYENLGLDADLRYFFVIDVNKPDMMGVEYINIGDWGCHTEKWRVIIAKLEYNSTTEFSDDSIRNTVVMEDK